MSLFGQPQQQQQGGLFGSSAPAQPAGGLFGSAQPSASGGLFGQQPQQQQQVGGLFGQPQQQQPQQSGFFGQQQQPQQQQFGGMGGMGGMFGQQQPQQQQQQMGGGFGQQQPQQQQQQQQQQSGGGLFFQQPQQQQQSGGLFGQSTVQQQPGGGLFGQPQQQAAPTLQTGGLFGQSNQQPQQQQTGGLFGQQQPQQQPTGGLFGQPQQQPQQQTGGFFGQQPQQQQQPGGLFGQQPQQQQQTGGLFGQPTQQTGGLFGQSTQQPQQQTGGLFGNTMGPPPQPQQQQGFGGSILGATINPQQLQQQQGPNAIVEKVTRVRNSWNADHPDYAFRYYFYNHVGKERASQFQKPANEDSEAWERAWSERPNDSCVPVRANGFKELDMRVTSQEVQVAIFRSTLHSIQEKLQAIQGQHDVRTSAKLDDCRRRHQALARRALSLAAKVQVLKNRGYALQPEEETLKKRLEGLAKTVQDPAASGRINEIWARMMVVEEKARVMEESQGKVDIVWDENQLQIAGRLLQSNFEGLGYLTKEVLSIEKALGEWQEAHQERPTGL